jgi:hypothetical protein
MRRTTFLAALLVLGSVLAIAPAYAHEGHSHTIMGTVVAQRDGRLEVKTTEGKTLMIGINAKTSVVRGKKKAEVAGLAAGERVVVDVGDGKEPMVAREIKLAAK